MCAAFAALVRVAVKWLAGFSAPWSTFITVGQLVEQVSENGVKTGARHVRVQAPREHARC